MLEGRGGSRDLERRNSSPFKDPAGRYNLRASRINSSDSNLGLSDLNVSLLAGLNAEEEGGLTGTSSIPKVAM
jgi:hypothetical protein